VLGAGAQLITGLPGELGIQSQYLDRELHLVDDALAGSVTAAEQFEVSQNIILPVTIDVVDGFFFEQLPTQVLLHNPTMLKHRSLFSVVSQRGYGAPYIPMSFNMTPYSSFVETVESCNFHSFVFAFSTAIFLFCVNAATGFSAFCYYLFASRACKGVTHSGIFSASYVRARTRAVQRRPTKSLFVSVYEHALVREWRVQIGDRFDIANCSSGDFHLESCETAVRSFHTSSQSA
jgi:hypothetical protein